MNKLIAAFFVASSLFACKKLEPEKFQSFGDSISAANVISKGDLLAKFETLKEGDTINVKFRSEIKDVCQKKGCWMNVALNDEKNTFVRFKDYGFFMPLNAAGREVILDGKAFISVETVEELKHYAKDAGKSQAAIDSITAPKTSYSFLSHGVLIKQ